MSSARCDADEPDLRQAVVHITANLRAPNYFQPWLKQSGKVTGSGSLLPGNRVLTNAHVVAYANQIEIQGFQSADKVSAKILFVAHNLDLAILEVEDASFCSKRPTIEIAKELPKSGQTVSVLGYPLGGTDLSTTEGVVSRIELHPYFDNTNALRIQVDAAINPGNSGGPAIIDKKLVGVAFSRVIQSDNIGYLIPAEEVLDLLKDIEDGKLDGRPQWWHSYQPLENPALRSYFKLSDETNGVLISTMYGIPDDNELKVGDIVTHIQDFPIERDGKVTINSSLRVPFFYYVPKLAENNHVRLTILREGISQNISAKVGKRPQLAIQGDFGSYPSYFIYGPLCFSVPSRAMLDQVPPPAIMALLQRNSPILMRRLDPKSFDDEQLVTISSDPFSSPLMKGFNPPTLATLAKINGTTIRNLKHAAETIRGSKDELIRFEFADWSIGSIVFKRAEIDAISEAILQENGVRADCSSDLNEVWHR